MTMKFPFLFLSSTTVALKYLWKFVLVEFNLYLRTLSPRICIRIINCLNMRFNQEQSRNMKAAGFENKNYERYN